MTPEPLRIVIVDDDPCCLSGMRRRLESYTRRWELTFTGDAREALARVERDEVDVVVADLFLPGQSGADLLEQVREVAPRTTRILMTAATTAGAVMHASTLAHLFLPKPYVGDELEELIERASSLRRIRVPPELAGAIGAISKGPLFPLHVRELIDPLHSVARSRDPEPARLLAGRLFEQLRVSSGIDPNPHWELGCRAGDWAAHIGTCEGLAPEVRAHAVMASLLHRLGLMLVARHAPDRLGSGEALDPAAHAQVGAYTLGLWGFPDPIVEAVALYASPAGASRRSVGAPVVTHVACVLAEALAKDPTLASSGVDPERLPGLDWAHLDSIGLRDRVDTWLASAAPELLETERRG